MKTYNRTSELCKTLEPLLNKAKSIGICNPDGIAYLIYGDIVPSDQELQRAIQKLRRLIV